MKMFCNIYDDSTNLVVVNAYIVDFDQVPFIKGTTAIEIIDSAVYDSIVYNLAKGNRVKLPKLPDPVVTNISATIAIPVYVSPETITPLGTADLIVETPVDALETARLSAFNKIINAMYSNAGASDAYDMYEFNIVDVQLVSNGYKITDANQDAQYNVILNTADAVLIGHIEKYIAIKAKLEANNIKYLSGKQALADLELAIDTSDIDTILSAFLAA